MKKVSVQFNMEVADEMTHENIEKNIRELLPRPLTSLEINNIEVTKEGKCDE